MDVFVDVAEQGGSFFADCAVAAAHDLGVFDRLEAGGFISTDGLAGLLDVAPHRLGPLLAVLALKGHVRGERDVGRIRWRLVHVPDRPDVPRSGLGLLTDVLREDEPVVDEGYQQAGQDDAYLAYLAQRARETAHRVFDLPLFADHAPGHLLDAGGGHGEYAFAWVMRDPGNTATVIDQGANLDVARETGRRPEHAEASKRVRFIDGDLAFLSLTDKADIALLGNVVHLHGKAAATQIARQTAANVRSGGRLVVKEVLLDELHTGPAAGAFFSLSLVAYTEAGRCYEVAELQEMARKAVGGERVIVLREPAGLAGQVLVSAKVGSASS